MPRANRSPHIVAVWTDPPLPVVALEAAEGGPLGIAAELLIGSVDVVVVFGDPPGCTYLYPKIPIVTAVKVVSDWEGNFYLIKYAPGYRRIQ